MTISFNGTGITWIGKKGTNFGNALVSIDGVAQTTVHGYSAQSLTQNANYVSPTLSSGSHVLQIANLASNPNASDYWVTVDAFLINGSALPQSSGTIQSAVDATEAPSSAWQYGTGNSQDLSNGHCWTNPTTVSTTTNPTISWTFTGTLIEVRFRRLYPIKRYFVSTDKISRERPTQTRGKNPIWEKVKIVLNSVFGPAVEAYSAISQET